MKATITISVDVPVLEHFYRKCEKKGVSKSSIMQQLIIEYLENGLRGDPSTTGRRQHYDFDRSQKGSDD